MVRHSGHAEVRVDDSDDDVVVGSDDVLCVNGMADSERLDYGWSDTAGMPDDDDVVVGSDGYGRLD